MTPKNYISNVTVIVYMTIKNWYNYIDQRVWGFECGMVKSSREKEQQLQRQRYWGPCRRWEDLWNLLLQYSSLDVIKERISVCSTKWQLGDVLEMEEGSWSD